jgi:hypothetical protein
VCGLRGLAALDFLLFCFKSVPECKAHSGAVFWWAIESACCYRKEDRKKR